MRRDRGRTPGLETLETRSLLSGILVGGAGAGGAPTVQVFDADTGAERYQFSAYPAGMTAGVRVAIGDIDGDGALDIVTAPGPGASPVIKVFRSSDGALIGQFNAPRAWSAGGTWIASGDVDGDGRSEIVIAPGVGAPFVRVYEGLEGQLEESFRANTGATRGGWGRGAKVTAGDLNHDGRADVVALSASGPSRVRVFDGQSGALLSDIRAFQGPSRGKTSVAVGKIDGDRYPDLVVARAAPRSTQTTVKVYRGLSDSEPARFVVPNSANGGGVEIATVNVGGRGRDELAFAPTRGGGLGAPILSSDPLLSLSLSSSAGAPSLTTAYRLPSANRGLFLAGDNSVAMSTPAVAVNAIEPPLSQSLPAIDRLAYFDPTTQQFVSVKYDDLRLAGKDITVISHGWAPGYEDWVNYEADKGHVLKWWETDPSQSGYDPSWTKDHPQIPDSQWLLHGETVSNLFGTTEVSAVGLAQSILARTTSGDRSKPIDPNAVVLAYSWIDDSATPEWNALITKVPEDAYRSEALTTLNGERLASALESALGTSFTGKLQLIGHSHGSKVVSVAAAALQQAKMRVDQVTLLDSPEDDDTILLDAANFNWYFLKDLPNIDRSKANSTFVDSYISEFGEPYSGITLSNGQGENLNQIVDVKLTPDIYYSYDLGGRHGYAASWYGGSADPSLTYEQKVGQYWSPLLPANTGSSSPVKGLSPYYEQNWDYFSQPVTQQFVLNPQNAAPAETIKFTTLDNPDVAVTQIGVINQSQPVKVRAPLLRAQSGIAFDYQFTNFQPGDRLTILADGSVAFVMDAALVGSGPAHATLSLNALPFGSHNLTVVLTSATSNTTSRVVVKNFQSFYQPIF